MMHADYTPLDHRSPSLPAIDELQTTIATLGDTATNEDNRRGLPQNLFSGIEAILQADKTASPPASPSITRNIDFDRVKVSHAAAPPLPPRRLWERQMMIMMNSLIDKVSTVNLLKWLQTKLNVFTWNQLMVTTQYFFKSLLHTKNETYRITSMVTTYLLNTTQ
jgi:hypothetical protein